MIFHAQKFVYKNHLCKRSSRLRQMYVLENAIVSVAFMSSSGQKVTATGARYP